MATSTLESCPKKLEFLGQGQCQSRWISLAPLLVS